MKLFKSVLSLLLVCIIQHALAQEDLVRTVRVPKGMEVVLRDTSFITQQDTVLYLTYDWFTSLRIRKNPYEISTNFYDTLRKRSTKNKFTKALIDLVVKRKKRKEKLVDAIVKSETVFKPYSGYRIASISFKHVDLLEGSVIDTLQYATTRFGKFVNKVHHDTRNRIIANNLLFGMGDEVDPYTLADNERVLRQLPTLRDARIYLRKNEINPQEVEVVVVTQDVTSIGVSGDYQSPSLYRFDLYDVNMLGYAREVRLSYFRNADAQTRNGYEVLFREPNFIGTFLQGEAQYTHNYLRQRTRLSMGRDFFTPAIKYAGGAEWYRTEESFYFEQYDTFKLPYTENAYDLWAGRSFEFRKRYNLILTLRMNSRDFRLRPFVESDSNSFFHNRIFMLSGISLVKRNYLKSMLIRGFGKTEDIPIGGAVGMLLGTEYNEFADRRYVELNTTFGRYFSSIGYFNVYLATGSFTKASQLEDGLFHVGGTYFSDLFKVKRLKTRQFICASYTKGFTRVLDRTLQVDGKWENENALPPFGNQRLTLGLETVHFMPWYTYGFQVALFHRLDVSLLSYDRLLARKNTFASLRVGMRTLNENLVLPLLSIEVGYFIKTHPYPAGWEIRFSTSLPRLFNTNHYFKPMVAVFN